MTATTPALEEATARLERDAPGYLERVRTTTARLRARPGALGDPRVALEALGDVADIDAEVPTASSRQSVHLVKVAIRRGLGWYVRYLGGQVTALGHAVTHLGGALVERTEQLGDETAELQRQVRELSARLERLEHPAVEKHGPGGAGDPALGRRPGLRGPRPGQEQQPGQQQEHLW